MNRLTHRLENQCGDPTDSIILEPYMRYNEESTKKKILNRLAEYEDTGLTPQEIKQLSLLKTTRKNMQKKRVLDCMIILILMKMNEK